MFPNLSVFLILAFSSVAVAGPPGPTFSDNGRFCDSERSWVLDRYQDEKSAVIYDFVATESSPGKVIICVGHAWPFVIAHSYLRKLPRTGKKIWGMQFDAMFYEFAPAEVLRGVSAHEIAHKRDGRGSYCEQLLKRGMRHAYARCELGVDIRAAEMVGLCTTLRTLRFMREHVSERYPEADPSFIDERIAWLESGGACTEERGVDVLHSAGE